MFWCPVTYRLGNWGFLCDTSFIQSFALVVFGYFGGTEYVDRVDKKSTQVLNSPLINISLSGFDLCRNFVRYLSYLSGQG